MALGLSMLLPTVHWETHLFERVAAALDGGPAPTTSDVTPPVDLSSALDKLHDVLHVR